jgi:hypothetical protein
LLVSIILCILARQIALSLIEKQGLGEAGKHYFGNIQMPRKKLKIMVSSTVYGAESELDQIQAVLSGYGYEVVISKGGTVYVPPGYSAEEACLKAVDDCDLFLGIIFPRYGSGITHKEFKRAIEKDKPRWFIAHYYVTFAREILKQYMFTKKGTRRKNFKFRKTGIMDNIRVIDMYNDAIANEVPFGERRSNWAQPFFKTNEIMDFLKVQFKDINLKKEEIKAWKDKAK